MRNLRFPKYIVSVVACKICQEHKNRCSTDTHVMKPCRVGHPCHVYFLEVITCQCVVSMLVWLYPTKIKIYLLPTSSWIWNLFSWWGHQHGILSKYHVSTILKVGVQTDTDISNPIRHLILISCDTDMFLTESYLYPSPNPWSRKWYVYGKCHIRSVYPFAPSILRLCNSCA